MVMVVLMWLRVSLDSSRRPLGGGGVQLTSPTLMAEAGTLRALLYASATVSLNFRTPCNSI